ncbi:hypothetical protein OsJ_19836 [Oryza sativa Japonica Group]|uniref:Uncharacterized protein n=1 Tax=Oryza sativa subsp. japonica TaxID=39947 RepID=B9FR40_ORYSJ|nr:hypothetical protein OsJ_19836 [Oryza sativa Japonica Group]
MLLVSPFPCEKQRHTARRKHGLVVVIVGKKPYLTYVALMSEVLGGCRAGRRGVGGPDRPQGVWPASRAIGSGNQGIREMRLGKQDNGGISGTSFPIGGDNGMMGADNERAEGPQTMLLVEEGIRKVDTEFACISYLTPWRWCNQAVRWLAWKTGTTLAGLVLPDTWSWEKIVGSPAVQGRGGCSLSACTVCTEAQHRMIYDRLHGSGSFRWRVEVPPTTLRMECIKKEAWNPEEGGKVEHVLEVVVGMGGLPTMDDDYFLPVVGLNKYPGPYKTQMLRLTEYVKPLTAIETARLIRQRGPIIGALACDASTVLE